MSNTKVVLLLIHLVNTYDSIKNVKILGLPFDRIFNIIIGESDNRRYLQRPKGLLHL